MYAMRLSKFRPAPFSEIIITSGPGWLIFLNARRARAEALRPIRLQACNDGHLPTSIGLRETQNQVQRLESWKIYTVLTGVSATSVHRHSYLMSFSHIFNFSRYTRIHINHQIQCRQPYLYCLSKCASQPNFLHQLDDGILLFEIRNSDVSPTSLRRCACYSSQQLTRGVNNSFHTNQYSW